MLATWGCTTFPKPTLSLDFLGATSLDSGITFSRGSQATLFDSTGTLRYAKHNLVTYSDDLTNAAWTKTAGTSISSNTVVSPDGTQNADKFIENSTTGGKIISNGANVVPNITYTLSCFAKASERTAIAILAGNTGFGGTASVVFNLSTGVASTGIGSPLNAFMTPVGNGWYRCGFSFAAVASAPGDMAIYILNGTDWASRNYTGNGTSGVFIWGGQLNLANMEGGVTSSLTTYYPTTTAAYYAPRFDYNPSTLQPRGLLIEEQRTNSIRNNTMQGAVAGTPGTSPTNWSASVGGSGITRTIVGTGTENGITYIDFQFSGTGSGSAFQVINTETTTGIAAATGQTWSGSFYLKLVAGSTTGTNITMQLLELASGSGVIQNLSAALSPTTQGLATQRTTYSATLSGGATVTNLQQGLRLLFTNGVAVDITLRIGLPQLEQGAFATSVIPTTTTALTRNADVASMTGTNFSSWYNNSAGTFYAQFLVPQANTSGLWRVFSGNVTNTPQFFNNGGLYNWSYSSDGVSTLSAPVANVVTKFAGAYAANDVIGAINGTLGAADTSVTTNTPTALTLGAANAVANRELNGWLQRIAYYPTRLPNTTLQALTA